MTKQLTLCMLQDGNRILLGMKKRGILTFAFENDPDELDVHDL